MFHSHKMLKSYLHPRCCVKLKRLMVETLINSGFWSILVLGIYNFAVHICLSRGMAIKLTIKFSMKMLDSVWYSFDSLKLQKFSILLLQTSCHSSMVSTAACYRGGPGFKSRQGRKYINFWIKCKFNNSNLNTIIVWVYELTGLVFKKASSDRSYSSSIRSPSSLRLGS